MDFDGANRLFWAGFGASEPTVHPRPRPEPSGGKLARGATRGATLALTPSTAQALKRHPHGDSGLSWVGADGMMNLNKLPLSKAQFAAGK